MFGRKKIETGRLYKIEGTDRKVTAVQPRLVSTLVIDFDESGKKKRNLSDRTILNELVPSKNLTPVRRSVHDWVKNAFR